MSYIAKLFGEDRKPMYKKTRYTVKRKAGFITDVEKNTLRENVINLLKDVEDRNKEKVPLVISKKLCIYVNKELLLSKSKEELIEEYLINKLEYSV